MRSSTDAVSARKIRKLPNSRLHVYWCAKRARGDERAPAARTSHGWWNVPYSSDASALPSYLPPARCTAASISGSTLTHVQPLVMNANNAAVRGVAPSPTTRMMSSRGGSPPLAAAAAAAPAPLPALPWPSARKQRAALTIARLSVTSLASGNSFSRMSSGAHRRLRSSVR